MAYRTRSRTYGSAFSGQLPDGVRWLLIANVSLFLLSFFAGLAGFGGLFRPFELVPRDVVTRLFLWQPVTYLFLHGGIWHVLFNMLSLWFFGTALEQTWGTRRFLNYYFLCGVVAGLCVIVANYLFGHPDAPTIGSSGAVYGLLLAFGVLFPEEMIIFLFFPIKAKYFVMILAAVELLIFSQGVNTGVSNVAHLGGLLFGFAYLKSRSLRGFDPMALARGTYSDWKLRRAKRKFEVYLRKHDRDRSPWTH